MIDGETYDVHPALREPANPGPTVQDLPPVPQEAAPEEAPTPSPEAPSPSPSFDTNEERNFKNLRQKAERLEKERNDALERLKAYESQQTQEEDLSLQPHDLAEGKHITKVQNKIQALEQQLIETRLRSQYPDIDNVVSPENLAVLQKDYPEIAATIGSSTNLYSKAVSAYTMLKKLGIAHDASPYQAEKAIAHKNAAKPRPLASVSPQQGDSPLSHANAFANGLTDDLKKQLHKEMMDSMKLR